ncbi:MAG: ABC transporter ATP-binding protein [bacterium]|nr:ABC transporter ATP-binding protein [bacterium]
MTPVLELSAVTKEFPGNPPVRALDGVSLRIESGELVGVVGASGSGKSTLLNVVGTLARPTTGEIRLEGRDIAKEPDRVLAGLRAARIGFVFQQFHLVAGLSAVDNVATGLVYRGVSHRKRRHASAEALDRVGLGNRGEHRPNQLSGGERQRVAIARALVGDPAIILADEPTGSLDSRTSDEIIGLLLDLNTQGATIVIITHDHAVADRLPRRLELVDGRIVSDRQVAGVAS